MQKEPWEKPISSWPPNLLKVGMKVRTGRGEVRGEIVDIMVNNRIRIHWYDGSVFTLFQEEWTDTYVFLEIEGLEI